MNDGNVTETLVTHQQPEAEAANEGEQGRLFLQIVAPDGNILSDFKAGTRLNDLVRSLLSADLSALFPRQHDTIACDFGSIASNIQLLLQHLTAAILAAPKEKREITKPESTLTPAEHAIPNRRNHVMEGQALTTFFEVIPDDDQEFVHSALTKLHAFLQYGRSSQPATLRNYAYVDAPVAAAPIVADPDKPMAAEIAPAVSDEEAVAPVVPTSTRVESAAPPAPQEEPVA